MADKATIPIMDADEYTDVRIGYDEDGNIIEESIGRYDENNELIETINYSYDEDGNMIMENNILDYDGKLERTIIIQYNQDGLPEVETDTLYSNEETIEHTYDDNGNEIGSKIYENGELVKDTVREYYSDGEIKQEVFREFKGGEMETFSRTEYSQERLERREFYQGDWGHGFVERNIERSYDEIGGEIKTKIYENGELVRDITREYDYDKNQIRIIDKTEKIGGEQNGEKIEFIRESTMENERETEVKYYSDGELTRHCLIEYDDDSEKYMTINATEGGEKSIIVKNYWDNILQTTKEYELNDGTIEKIEKTYDGHGHLEKETVYENGSITKETVINREDIGSGLSQEKEVTTYDRNGNIESIEKTGTIHSEEKFGHSVETIEKTTKDGEQTISIRETYFGDLERETTYKDGKIIMETIYDQENNEKEIITYDQDENIESVETDKIYKDESTSDAESNEDSVASGEENDDYEDDVDDDNDDYDPVD